MSLLKFLYFRVSLSQTNIYKTILETKASHDIMDSVITSHIMN